MNYRSLPIDLQAIYFLFSWPRSLTPTKIICYNFGAVLVSEYLLTYGPKIKAPKGFYIAAIAALTLSFFFPFLS